MEPSSRLICRVRPCDRPSQLVSVLEKEARVEVCPEKGHPGEPLRFDKVLGARGSLEQEEAFELVRPAVLACLSGTSCTIVAYGGPQSGKSYTLSGFFMTGHLHGLAPRAIQLIVEMTEANPSEAPRIEASFFEMQQDTASDLLPRACPKVTMRESAQPPYVVLDPALTVHRCDGGVGHNRLLDTYFTGLEHRRKGAHTCFQIAFVHANGQRSVLRFVEMAWPRSPTPSSSSSATTAASGRTSLSPAASAASTSPQSGSAQHQGRASTVLDEVVQCKLTGAGTPPYSSSLLALLLKPCFEGHALLYFVYCLRLEQIQLTCLAHAAPLLAKLHLWLMRSRQQQQQQQQQRGGAAGNKAVAGTATNPRQRQGIGEGGVGAGAVLVPPLNLGCATGAGGSMSAPVEAANMSGADGTITPSSSSSGLAYASRLDESGNAGSASVMASSPQPGQTGLAESSLAAGQQVVAPTIELRGVLRCSELLQAKQSAMELLRADALRSETAVRELAADLKMLREASGGSGPTQLETNYKMAYEKILRSLKATNEQIRRMEEDVHLLAEFCNNRTNVELTYDYAHPRPAQEAAVPPEPVAAAPSLSHSQSGFVGNHAQSVHGLGQGRGLSGPGAGHSASTGALPGVGRLLGSAEPAAKPVVVPQLPLAQLPVEHPELPSQVLAGADWRGAGQSLSPSSSESEFSPAHGPVVAPPAIPSSPMMGGTLVTAPKAPTATWGPAAYAPHASLPSSIVSLPKTPPQPERFVAGTASPPRPGPVPAQAQPRPPRSPDMSQSGCGGAWRVSMGVAGVPSPAGAAMGSAGPSVAAVSHGQMAAAEAWNSDLAGRVRKSHSATSLRASSGATRGGSSVGSSGAPVISPLPGHRPDRDSGTFSPPRISPGGVVSLGGALPHGALGPAPACLPKRSATAMMPARASVLASRPPGPRATTPAARLAPSHAAPAAAQAVAAAAADRSRASPTLAARHVTSQDRQRSTTATSPSPPRGAWAITSQGPLPAGSWQARP
eukprot:TRINITY_DN21678_c0_g2_i1.p1 TRINITY_DN21678_c0_g2~~TRINITY_DN21678_c0_g2_i1.p1  ORF type:complete len:1045 (+),score=185.54 TRINITY_DN21678_c0_g2_i1:105-3137(+)